MSVHGYPADMSIFCNLQLGLLELQEGTPQADIDQDNASLAGVLQGAVGRTVDTPVFARARFCWTIIRGFHTIAGGTEHAVGTRLDAVFPILQRLVDADFAAVEIGCYVQCWSCFSGLDVGWSEPFLFIFNAKQTTGITSWSWRHTVWHQTGSWKIVTLSALWPTSSKGT